MKRLQLLLYYECKNLLSQKGVTLSLVLLLLGGLCAILYGRVEITRQQKNLSEFPALQQKADEAYLQQRFGEGEPVGRLGYYFTLPTLHQPHPQSALALGVRDLHPYCLGIRLLGIRGQLYDSSLDNPNRAAAGHFDLAFVFTFLFPLVVIGLSYNLLSAEEEQGTLRLLQTTGQSLHRLLALKLGLRLALLFGSAQALLLAGWLLCCPGQWQAWSVWALLISLYLLFWCSLSLWIVSWRRSSTWNATALLGLWLVLTIMIPALSNLLSAALQPVGHGFELSMRSRQVMNDGWDQPRKPAFEAFLKAHPEWRSQLQPVLDKFTWSWYFAQHQRADDSVALEAEAYRKGLESRQDWAWKVALLCPPMQVQLQFDRLAGSDLAAQLAFWASVEDAHRWLQQFFYPRIFAEEELNPEQYQQLRQQIPPWSFSPSLPAAPVAPALLVMLAQALFLLALAGRRLGQQSL